MDPHTFAGHSRKEDTGAIKMTRDQLEERKESGEERIEIVMRPKVIRS